MVSDVFRKLLQGPDFRHLILGVRLSRFALINGVGEHVHTIINHIIARRRYGTWYLHYGIHLPFCPTGLIPFFVVSDAKVWAGVSESKEETRVDFSSFFRIDNQ